MPRLCCASCGQILTRECTWGTIADHNTMAGDRVPAVETGVMVRLPKEVAMPVLRGDEIVGVTVFSPANAISINPEDLVPDALWSTGPDNGCCGSDGSDPPNRTCGQCLTVVGNEWSDCWTQAEIRFLPDAVQVV